MLPQLFSWRINQIRLEEGKVKPGAGNRHDLFSGSQRKAIPLALTYSISFRRHVEIYLKQKIEAPVYKTENTATGSR
jgi:hypothetical protein